MWTLHVDIFSVFGNYELCKSFLKIGSLGISMCSIATFA